MENKIKKYSIFNLIGTILICLYKIIQNSFLDGDNHMNRRIISSIGLFFTIPTFFGSMIFFIIVWSFYFKKKFKYNLVFFYLTIPFLFIIIFLIYFLSCILIDLMFHS